ncbi:PEP-CTERM sorting domain-containing protein [Pseudoduganella lutea]|uniref:PEP-CTERM sorting domain-containing protein n=1 Tax=Pseudoduganella lutea TaxID=321985 RepID=A0A4P6KZE1_9BURK|nr:PEP-CTERM sorting domain-containing protein [Pseudoduganella lutea]QBE64619.1 PEP-CTERM sorting domain-containing protein [Pseudoduganella lutea]
MRTIVKNILVTGGMLMGLHTAAQAGPLLVVSNGILMGAQGVEYDGHHYNVSFSDIRPTNTTMAFSSFNQSWGASEALYNVFQDVYDTNPARTNGCSNSLSCLVVTGYSINFLGVTGVGYTNTASSYIDPVIPFLVVGNAANQSGVTYAHWSIQPERQVVPEPSTLLLSGLGLAALAVRRKRLAGKTVA